MEALVAARNDVNLRKIDIDRWGSPVARQYGIDSLPTLYLFNGEELVSKDSRDILRRLSSPSEL